MTTLARIRWGRVGAVLVMALSLAGAASLLLRPRLVPSAPGAVTAAHAVVTHPAGIWTYGHADARFLLVEYADLECPYCQRYFPVLKAWIDAHPDVRWQWHYLPLPMHEPAATEEARLVECVGQAGGDAAFWRAVAWVYVHTRSDGQGVPPGLRYPEVTAAVQQCQAGGQADAVIARQAAQALRDGIDATPTLRLVDTQSGKHVVLRGPAEGDVLLSALDWLTAPQAPAAALNSDMPADTFGDMPR